MCGLTFLENVLIIVITTFTSSNAGDIKRAAPHKNCVSIVHVFLSCKNLNEYNLLVSFL